MTPPWPSTLLGNIVSHRSEFIEIDDFQTYKRCRVQLHARGVVLRDRVEGLRLKTKKQQLCRTGELLVAEIDAKVGGYGLVPDELDGAIVSSHYFLYTVDESRLDKRFLGFYIRELLISSVRVAYDVLTPTFHMQPRIIAVPLDVKSEGEITLLANLISLSPGSLTLDVSPDRRALQVHVMYAGDSSEVAAQEIKQNLERRIIALFSQARS